MLDANVTEDILDPQVNLVLMFLLYGSDGKKKVFLATFAFLVKYATTEAERPFCRIFGL